VLNGEKKVYLNADAVSADAAAATAAAVTASTTNCVTSFTNAAAAEAAGMLIDLIHGRQSRSSKYVDALARSPVRLAVKVEPGLASDETRTLLGVTMICATMFCHAR